MMHEYKLEAYFVVVQEIHYGDVADKEMCAAMWALVGNRFGPHVDILHASLNPTGQRFDHDTVRVSHEGTHRRKPANPPPTASPGWVPGDVDDVEFIEVPTDVEHHASGMPTEGRMEDTMERFIRIVPPQSEGWEKKPKQKKKKRRRSGGAHRGIGRAHGKIKKAFMRRRPRHTDRAVRAIEASKRKEIES